MPGPDGSPVFRYPSAFDHQDPQAFFASTIVHRIQRKLEWSIWDMANAKAATSTRAGAMPEPELPFPQEEARAGGDQGLVTDNPRQNGDRSRDKGTGNLRTGNEAHQGAGGPRPARAYPAGKPLTSEEHQLSLTHAPRHAESQAPICWDAACHSGCTRTQCAFVHEPIRGTVHWTVAAQCARRGGRRNGPKIAPKDVDGFVHSLRERATQQDAAKKTDTPGAHPAVRRAAKKVPKAAAKTKNTPRAGGNLSPTPDFQ
jgi:hypothetical protein